MSEVPFYRLELADEDIQAVVDVLRTGWLTTGPLVKRFEHDFAAAVGGRYAVAVSSCTAALHLAVRALGLTAGQAVLVPTMTFAATAEVIRYEGAIPVLVDCEPGTLHMDLGDADRKLEALRAGRAVAGIAGDTPVVGVIPVHLGGLMMDIDRIRRFASERGLWVVEDAAHAFPAAWRPGSADAWQWCGQATSDVSCFSFYANKTITTGEGGMAVTDDEALAAQIRLLSLHGLSHDAWGRYSGGNWDYRIVAPGYKYNMMDVSAALGVQQVARAEVMRQRREAIALEYLERLAGVAEVDTPATPGHRIHAWHLFPLKLHLDRLSIDRDTFLREMRAEGVLCSVHWRPLHLHPYYEDTFRWQPDDLPVATREWARVLSLPLFHAMRADEVEAVVHAVTAVCGRARKA